MEVTTAYVLMLKVRNRCQNGIIFSGALGDELGLWT